MSIQPELKTVLKRLKLSGGMLATLPDRVAYARKEKLDYGQFLLGGHLKTGHSWPPQNRPLTTTRETEVFTPLPAGEASTFSVVWFPLRLSPEKKLSPGVKTEAGCRRMMPRLV